MSTATALQDAGTRIQFKGMPLHLRAYGGQGKSMNMAQRIQYALEDVGAGKLMPALMHACAAVDGTGAKLYPNQKNNRDRFVDTLDRYLWVVEPMLGIGINLEETTFRWIALDKRSSKFSEVIYEIFRCNLAHGTEIPPGLEVSFHQEGDEVVSLFGQQQMVLPATVIFALLGLAVFSTANAGQQIGVPSWLKCGTMHFTIDDWWGREADARICFSTVNNVRIKMEF